MLRCVAWRSWRFAAGPPWRARDVAGWRLRFAGGYTKRANSINALGPDAQTDPATLEGLEAAYRERGQPPVWRLSPLAPPAIDGILAARGYRPIERSLLQVCPLHAGFAADPDVRIHPRRRRPGSRPSAAHSPVRPEHRETMQRMLAAIAAPVGFAFVEDARASRWPWRSAPSRATMWACSTCW